MYLFMAVKQIVLVMNCRFLAKLLQNADLIYSISPSSALSHRIKLDLSNLVRDGGSLRWMFVADQEVSDVADKLRAEYNQLQDGNTLTLLLNSFLLPDRDDHQSEPWACRHGGVQRLRAA